MELEVWTTILVAVAPAIAAVCTILGGLFGLAKSLKKNNAKQKEELNAALERLNKAYKDISTMKAQLTSINQYLIEQKEKLK